VRSVTSCETQILTQLADEAAEAGVQPERPLDTAPASPRGAAPGAPQGAAPVPSEAAVATAEAVEDALQLPGRCPAAAGQLGSLSFCLTQLLLDKPTDCFWLLQFGSFWACSRTAPAAAAATWRWTVQLPIRDPSQVGRCSAGLPLLACQPASQPAGRPAGRPDHSFGGAR
jgi:hypothetical protein